MMENVVQVIKVHYRTCSTTLTLDASDLSVFMIIVPFLPFIVFPAP